MICISRPEREKARAYFFSDGGHPHPARGYRFFFQGVGAAFPTVGVGSSHSGRL